MIQCPLYCFQAVPLSTKQTSTQQISNQQFSSLSLKPELVNNLETMGYHTMTPIQAQSLPHVINGADVIAQAKTGSGKTAAFGLGLLNKLDVKKFRIQALVLCPTRELADQVAKEIRKLARAIHNIKVLTLCGGMPFGPQKGSLEHGAHIIVGTPGRIEDHIGKGNLKLEHLNMLVLDEADRMLEMGFESALEAIFSRCPANKQNLLFSATFPEAINEISKHIMKAPVSVKVSAQHSEQSINQLFYRLEDHKQRTDALENVLLFHKAESAVVFCTTKKETQELADQLHLSGFSCIALHGDLEQKMRDQTLVRFANKSISVLVATDVAARGLDIDSVDLVVNYHMSKDPEVHVHRIGRTGRAGNNGIACSLISDKEIHKLIKLEEYLTQSFETQELPELENDCAPIKPKWACLQIDAGKKQKLRPGDILGALTAKKKIAGSDVGKIQVFDNTAYVAVKKAVANIALNAITQEKMKGRKFKARRIRS